MKHFSKLVALSMLATAASAGHAQSIGDQLAYHAMTSEDSQPRLFKINDRIVERDWKVPPHVGELSVRATVSQGKRQLPLRVEQQKGAYAHPAAIKITENADGSATLRFPESKTPVEFEAVDFDTVGKATRVFFEAGPTGDPGVEASRKTMMKIMAGGFAMIGVLLISFCWDPGEDPLSRAVQKASSALSSRKSRRI